jgi:hypothetical protein
MSDQDSSDSIYLEPGSVWRRGYEWHRITSVENGRQEIWFEKFGLQYVFWLAIKEWLALAKHPDTVLVYSPSGNKLPPKPGYVRVRIDCYTTQWGAVFYGEMDKKSLDADQGETLHTVITADVRLPTATEPDEVEGVTE